MKPHEEIAQLKKELAQKEEQIQGLLNKLKEQEERGIGKAKSKTRLQAEAAFELLKQGPVTVGQLKPLNDKYPSDCIFYVRNILKVDVKTVRTAAGSVYMLPQHFVTYQEGQAKERAAKEAAEQEAKEAIPPGAPPQAAAQATA